MGWVIITLLLFWLLMSPRRPPEPPGPNDLMMPPISTVFIMPSGGIDLEFYDYGIGLTLEDSTIKPNILHEPGKFLPPAPTITQSPAK